MDIKGLDVSSGLCYLELWKLRGPASWLGSAQGTQEQLPKTPERHRPTGRLSACKWPRDRGPVWPLLAPPAWRVRKERREGLCEGSGGGFLLVNLAPYSHLFAFYVACPGFASWATVASPPSQPPAAPLGSRVSGGRRLPGPPPGPGSPSLWV